MSTCTIDMELRSRHGQILMGNFEVERAVKLLELFLECEELADETPPASPPED